MKTEIYYKVVRQVSIGKFVSARSPLNYQRYYNLYRWTKSNTPLFVFKDYGSAKAFRCSNELIFKCEVKNPRRLLKAPSLVMDICKFWENKRKHRKQDIYMENTLPGTYVADEVKLLGEMHCSFGGKEL